MRIIQPRQQVEDLQLRGVARPAAHVRADEVLEAEVEHVEVARKPHCDGRRAPVLRVVGGHPAEVLQRLSSVAQIEVRLRRLERRPGVGIELRRVRLPPQRFRHAGCVREALELYVGLQRGFVLALLLELLCRCHRDGLPADGGGLGRREQRPGLELPRLHRGQLSSAYRIAGFLQEIHRALLLAKGHEHLHCGLVLPRAPEEDGCHQGALPSRRIKPSHLPRLHSQALQQELPGVARPPQRAEHARRFLHRAHVAEESRGGVALPGLLQAPRSIQRLLAGLGIHHSSCISAARRLSDSGTFASLIASSTVMSPCLSSLNRLASRLCIPLPSLEALSR